MEVRLLSFLKKAFNFILDLLILGFSAFVASLAFPSKYIENGVPFLAFFYLIAYFGQYSFNKRACTGNHSSRRQASSLSTAAAGVGSLPSNCTNLLPMMPPQEFASAAS